MRKFVNFVRFASRHSSASLRSGNDITPFAIGLLAVPVGTFALGCWQVQRRNWKLDLIKELEEKTSALPVSLPENLNDLEEMVYSRVKVRGHYLYDKEILLGPRPLIVQGSESSSGGLISSGQSGYYVITPFRLADRNLTILVNRGWVPHSARKFGDTSRTPIPGPSEDIELEGLVRTSETTTTFIPKSTPETGVWHARDIELISKTLGTDPIFLDATEKMKYPNGPIPGQSRVTLRNEHMSYIFTWYTLSVLTGLMWYRNFVQKRPTFL